MDRTSQSALLRGMRDEELARLAKDGDNDALTALIQRFAPLVQLRARSYLRNELDADDLYQEGMIALLKAVRNYRDDLPGSFKTFAIVCVNNKMLSAVKAHMRDKNAPMRGYVSLSGSDAPEQLGVVAAGDDPELLVIRNEETDARNRRIENLLSIFERQVLQLYLSSYSYDEMSKQLGSSTKAVDNALQRVRRKLRNVFTCE